MSELMEKLWRQGLESFDESTRERISKGTAVGLAVAHGLDVHDAVDAAVEILTDWNGHTAAAAVRALTRHCGEAHRDGRVLTITLPPHWAEL